MQLVIAEKPSVAKSIADVLGALDRQDGYFEGGGYLVSWCVGHLIELAEPESYGEQWKKWTYESLPVNPEHWQYEIKEDTKEQYDVLYGLLHDSRVDEVVCATDAGREGELIFRLVYNMASCKKPMKRLWISSMEESAIREGVENLKPGSDYDHLYHSALCRQEADWLVGINGTRLFTVLYGGKVLKVGRVQTPTLAMLVEREAKIMNFKKEQYFMAHILCGGVDAVTERIDNKTEAENVAGACRNGQALVTSVEKEEKTVSPPKLYDLTTLQRDANRLFGFTAKQTLEYTQSLYEKKMCTYPRTDSQYLSDDMEQTAGNVIEAIFSSILFEENRMFNPDIKRVLNSKKVTDHHAIIPTMEIAKADLAALPETERKILSLVANRLLCATGEKHLYETVKAELSCGGYTFTTSGKSVLKNGWKDFEDAFKRSFKATEEKEQEDKKLPELSEGQTFDGVQTKISEHYTTPPKHFTEDSLLSAMERAGNEDMSDDVERKGLGTPATRADIIEKLVKDGFVKREKKQMLPTEDGMKLITVLPDVVKSSKLTADWENALTLVAKGEMEREDFMADIETMESDLIHTYHEVSDEQKKMFAQEQKVLGKCPNCGGEVVKGKYGAFCKNKCGMNVSRIMGVALSDEQVESLLAGKKTLLKGITSKAGKKYDAYIIPSGTEEYHYTKDGEEKSGAQFKFVMEFPNKKFTGKKK
ncbi:DNA topoisomerase III, bacteria and conjugative plasmid [Coprococcus sp. ART55/1]|jgi:DNA topoisomerase-3|uniref:type IA DNA topoisomerase n=1 Tax=Lachnospiraceae TaxID=186803 RepID=UPI0001CCCC8D|nr:type IA DNA topoisomerase [Coprococcus sp. ART55/1]CBK82567.1 DNA topoisomerase III, bacteria and conjugative plasmid [Coprococcus sp. ART55/1]